MEAIIVDRLSWLSRGKKNEIGNRVEQVRTKISITVYDLFVSLWEKEFHSLKLAKYEIKNVHTRMLGDITYFRNQVEGILNWIGIRFLRSPPLLSTIMRIVNGWKKEAIHTEDEDSFEVFFEWFHFREVYSANLLTCRNRISAMEKAITEFNKQFWDLAWFKLPIRAAKKIISKFWLNKRLHTDHSGMRYWSIGEIKTLLSQEKWKGILLKEVNVWWWQWWWKNFSQELNKLELLRIRRFRLPSDVRLLRDMLKIKTIRKDIILWLLWVW